MQLATVAEDNVFADDAVGADFAAIPDLCLRMDDCSGVSLNHYASRSMSMKVTSASLTGSLLTRQVPLALPILPRDLVSSTSMTRLSPGRTGLRHFTLSADMK